MLLFTFSVGMSVGCSGDSLSSDPREQAKQVADTYLDQNYNSHRQSQATVKDLGSEWQVIYHLPPGWTGGEKVVGVDKNTMKVTGFVAGQ
jgi:hypothetical protein